ncbi:MAG: alpha/beta hydrolase [Pseudomonadota bacterium]
MPTLHRGETTIEYEVHGSGHPLLLLAPGGMRSATSIWGRAPFNPISEFVGQYRVIAMDQRNAGASRAPITAADGWHSYADDQLALLDELKVERCHLLGGCIGGAFALSLIARAPARVSAAVLQQPIGYSGTNREVFYELFDGWAAELKQTRTDIADDALPPFRSRLYDGDFVFSVSRESVAECPVPLLVLRGNDVYHPGPISEEIVRLAPRAELVHDWKTGDHLPLALARVRQFLGDHSSGDHSP